MDNIAFSPKIICPEVKIIHEKKKMKKTTTTTTKKKHDSNDDGEDEDDYNVTCQVLANPVVSAQVIRWGLLVMMIGGCWG